MCRQQGCSLSSVPGMWPPAAASSAPAIAVTAATSASSAAAFFARPRFIDGETAPFQIFPGSALDCGLSPFRSGHSDKRETARAAGGTVRHQIYICYRAESGKKILQIVFRYLKGKIPHEQF